jgi:magnesium chelatase subunit I
MGPERSAIPIMPYALIVGQSQLRLALELAFVAPRLEGVLLSGQRGTGKSTAVRAFSMMAYDRLPVTLPINATEDRVAGGWDVDRLLGGDLVWQPGLLEEADGGMLYIDEVNLLDDHIVNIVLDVASTGVLVVDREGHHTARRVQFTMVGTMNPSEGGLRPQLLDRFALLADVVSEAELDVRSAILQSVLDYEQAQALERSGTPGPALDRVRAARDRDLLRRGELEAARELFPKVTLNKTMAAICVTAAQAFEIEGHRGDYVAALSAQAHAALRGAREVAATDVLAVMPLALQHRRAGVAQGGGALWTSDDQQRLEGLIDEISAQPERVASGEPLLHASE